MFGNRKHLPRWLAIAVAIGLACCAAALAAKPVKPVTPAYTIVPFLATPPQDFQSVRSDVQDLNDLGRAVGFEEFRKQLADGSYETLYWGLHLDTATGACAVLHDARGAAGINNLNQIVGCRFNWGGAFWKAPDDDNPVDLPQLSGDIGCDPRAINDAGIVVGNSLDFDGEGILGRGVIWRVAVDEDGAVSVDDPVELPRLADNTQAWAVDLSELSNGSFHVTGYCASEEYGHEAVGWTVAVDPDGTIKPGPAVSLVENHTLSYGYGVNIDGDVCGSLEGYEMPSLARAGQAAQLLPMPPDTHWGEAVDINNLGEIVGVLDIYPYKTKGWINTPGNFYAYLWKNGNPIDLTTQIDPATGWTRLRWATAINDAGVIGGTGYRGSLDVQWRGFVLIPIAP